VVLFHFSGIFRLRESTAVGTILARGWMGVDLFFVLSGFLITGILLDSRGADGYFSSFYARRFLRIFPLYYGFLALWFLVLAYVFGSAYSDLFARERQVWFWSYTANWGRPDELGALGHFWSLAIEEQFYLVWPLVVWLLG